MLVVMDDHWRYQRFDKSNGSAFIFLRMKRLIFFSVLYFFSFILYAQDTIILRSGEEIKVNIVKNTSDFVEYIYPNETTVNQTLKKTIRKIVFSSGREEICNSEFVVPEVRGEQDWKKVIITYEYEDVRGLTRVGDVKATGAFAGPFASAGLKNAIKRIKHRAAKIGAGIVLIHNKPDVSGALPGNGVQLLGTAYK